MIIGLTGGVASGKSTAAAELARLGARVVDADVIVHYLQAYDPAILAAIRADFGDAVFTRYGALDRGAFGRLVFDDADARRRLEALLHPPVIDVISANITAARRANLPLVVVVPLLFEGGYQGLFDETWVISVTDEVQLERLAARGGLDGIAAEKVVAAQMPLVDKELLADRVIGNNGSLQQLAEAMRIEWEGLTDRDAH